MWIKETEALEIYAEFCCKRYGRDAKAFALDHARDLEGAGDIDGARIWERLAEQIGRSQGVHRSEPQSNKVLSS